MTKYTFMMLLLTSITTVLCGCSDEPQPMRGDLRGTNFPLLASDPDTRPFMSFDIDKPYWLAFGRGSGRHGYDTIVVNEKRDVTLLRLRKEWEDDNHFRYVYERATLSASVEVVSKLAATINDLRIVEMERAYHADGFDGTQWEFRLLQEGREKQIYFNNHFPEAIQDFAITLDSLTNNISDGNCAWTRISHEAHESYREATWNSIHEKPNHH